ncbi:MAG: 16S rRNA (guanine(966)-N(2))-methyltransferase RsmD [Deltaproteobacteria bacterium]|nr:16S rRNA (guanine(966)-N(2))-methyltransferase RsmD [Deltaproteobacteria bacterium]
MRIISGSLKNLRLTIPAKAKIRPTSERLREALFSALGSSIHGIDVLDLFAGSGALGIEALSRGAKSVTLVERDLRLARNLMELRSNLKEPQAVEVLNMDVVKSLDYLSRESAKFGVIFLDPPYDSNWILKLLSNETFLSLISPAGLVVVERAGCDKDLQFHNRYKLERIFSRKYGSSMLEIFSFVNSELSLYLESC